MKPSTRNPSYVYQTPHSYCFRMRVPADLQPLVNRKEFRYSLKTCYLGIAKSKARFLAGNVQWLFEILRYSGDWMDKLTDDQMQQMINRYIRNKLESLERKRAVEGIDIRKVMKEDEMLKDFILENQSELVDGSYENAGFTVKKILDEKGIAFDSKIPEHAVMCREYLKAETEMFKVERNRISSDYSDDIDKLFPLNDKKSSSKADSQSESITLEQLMDEYWKRRQAGWGGAADEAYDRYSRRLLEHFGKDTPINSISYKKMEQFRDKLMETGNKGKPVSIKTVNLHLEFYSGLFNHAIQSGRIEYNPVAGVKLSDKRDQQGLNDPFPKEDLIKLFHSEQYTDDKFKESWMFWLPILLLFTGARIEELCQLYIDEIKQVEGGFQINGIRLKSHNSLKEQLY